jgi:hypothetical protein
MPRLRDLRKAWSFRIDSDTPTEIHPNRMYEFFIHPECLQRVAKPGFAGLEKL